MAEVARYRFDERKLQWFARKIYTENDGHLFVVGQ